MHTAFLRDGDVLVAPEPIATGIGLFALLSRLMEEMVHANGNALPSTDRELSPEWFQYPPF